jgi:hypothetical protein
VTALAHQLPTGVTRGLDPRVHLVGNKSLAKLMDCRVKPGNDDLCRRTLVRRQGLVTRGLDPRVHPFRDKFVAKKMDCRVKPGNDS